MKRPVLSEKHEDLAPLVAQLLSEASEDYAEFWTNLDARPSTEEEDKLVASLIREGGAEFAVRLAYLDRLMRESVVDLGGRAFPPPLGVENALRDLQDSYTLMIAIESYRDLLRQPLVPWPEIEAELQKPECREWMKTALAAY